MKRFIVISISLIALIIFVTFIGFPYSYHLERYDVEKVSLELGSLEINIGLSESASKYILGAPVVTGSPYRLAINAYGNKETDRKLILHSAKACTPAGKEYNFIEQPIEAEFIAHSIWRTFLYPKGSISPEFKEGEKLIVILDLSLETISGTERKKISIPFVAKLRKGTDMFPLIAVLYA